MNEQLIQRLKSCTTLPTLPSIAVQVLELAQKPEADIPEIARVICKDPALSSKILRTVNSSFYGRSHNVSTISHALVILGLQSVKTLVLGFSLVSNLQKNKSKGFQHLMYWKRAVHSATAARSIAAKVGIVQQEEAFLAALLCDIGMLIFDQVVPDEYSEICAKATSHQDLVRLETETLGMTHADAGGLLAEQWKLPPLLATPIGKHHSPETVSDPALKRLSELVHLAGRCADVFVDESPADAIAQCKKLFLDSHKIAEADADAVLADIGKKTKEVATLFEINIGAQAGYDAILKRANEALVELTLQSQAQATQLQQQNSQLQEQAFTDALMGIPNRAKFDTASGELFNAHLANKQPLSLLMLDLDKFKSINDKFGHPGGDAVLKYLGRILKAVARKAHLPCRYGGEEVALLLPNTDRATATTIAETIRRALAEKPVLSGNQKIPATTSVGVATWEAGSPLTQVAQLIKAADLALYNAKQSGRNCVKVFSLKRPTAGATSNAA
jgi:diguanylate cyclase (GGDEF)-like protein